MTYGRATSSTRPWGGVELVLGLVFAGALVSGLACTAERRPAPGDEGSQSARPRDPLVPVERTTQHDGRAVGWTEVGAGEPALVLIHGWASDRRVWRFQLESLRERYRLVAIDLPGHGESERPAAEYSMDLFADAVAAVMDDAEVERAVLVGHSNGTPVVRQFYRRYPERTRALVVVDGALRRVFTDEMAEQMRVRLESEDWQTTVAGFVDGMPGPGLSEELREEIKTMAMQQPQHAVVGNFVASAAEEIWEDDPIEVPTLLALIPQPTWSKDYLNAVEAMVPDLELVMVDGASHFVMMERPQRFDEILTGFVDSLE